MTSKLKVILAAAITLLLTDVAQAESSALIDAVKRQDAEVVKQLLTDGSDPNVRQNDGSTALHWAIYHESRSATEALIAANADVNAVNRLGASALYMAAKSGNAEQISLLLEAGADLSVTLPMGETPLMTASRAGSAEGVRLLLAAGADVNAREESREQTALMWAASQGHVAVAHLLVNAGANLEARSKIRSHLMYADAANGGAFDQGVMEQLGGYSPLLFAARNGDIEMTHLLLSAEANIEGAAANGSSPLVVAAHSGHGELARLLLERGADANAIGAGYTALHSAILRGDLTTIEALLEHGADPNARLLRAHPVQRASEDWVLKTPMIGATPYWIAASFREAEIMRTLSENGADPLLTNQEQWSIPRAREDRDSYTPVAVGGFESSVQAVIKGDSTRGRYYVQPNPDPAGEEQLALAAVVAALELGVDVNHRDFNQSTALHDAAARTLPNIVRELALRGADINALNADGQTPLDLALRAESRPNFFGFNTSILGPSASEVLKALGAMQSQ
ncbi:MAG: ankyrin repeat domain-containing protein [Pseudohongiellaceae bacterium]